MPAARPYSRPPLTRAIARRTAWLLLCLFVAAPLGAADLPRYSTLKVQLDTARSAAFRVSCRMPAQHSYARRRGVMTFTLEHGDIGRCHTDAQARTSAKGVPYMERAEVYTGFQPVGPRYRFSAEIHMDPQAKSSHNTTVMQIHQWVQESCQCGPPVMMSFMADGRLRARILRKPHTHDKIVVPGWRRRDFEDKWVEIAVDITSAYGRQNVTIWIGGQKALTHKALVQPGGALFMKTGLLRPGSTRNRLPRDRLHVRNPRIAVLP